MAGEDGNPIPVRALVQQIGMTPKANLPTILMATVRACLAKNVYERVKLWEVVKELSDKLDPSQKGG